jgi:hypothetical protein
MATILPATNNPTELIELAADAATDMIQAVLNEGAAPNDPVLLGIADMATRILGAMLSYEATPAADLLAEWCL